MQEWDRPPEEEGARRGQKNNTIIIFEDCSKGAEELYQEILVADATDDSSWYHPIVLHVCGRHPGIILVSDEANALLKFHLPDCSILVTMRRPD